MDPSLIWPVILVAAILLGFHGGYCGALSDACLKIGTQLEGASEGTTGFQDAITPPSSTSARLSNWLATLSLTVVSWYFVGVIGLAIFLILRLFATILLGAVIKADPPKKHFCRKIYRSMSNREADFEKAGDKVRAVAMRDLRGKFERSSYASQLGK